MRSRRSIFATLAALALIVGVGSLGLAQDDLLPRLERMVAQGRYDLATELLDDHVRRGEEVGVEAEWLRAQLETDPDRFDRMALEISGRSDATALREATVLARAREQFARGRYRTAAELLAPLAGTDQSRADPEVLLWMGMSEQAAGQPGAARRILRAIPKTAETYGTGRALLADLALRAGQLEDARDDAEGALDADPEVAALALSVLHRIAVAMDDEGQAESLAARLRSVAPESAEASWLSEISTSVPEPELPSGLTHDLEEGREVFALQFGAFRDRSLALRLAERVGDDVEEVRIELDRSEDAPWYRVVGGRYLTRSQAERARGQLEARGWSTLVLAPTRGGR